MTHVKPDTHLESLHLKLASLPKISDIISKQHFGAKKSLGQNFLIDETIVRQIVNSSNISNHPVLEVGPGLGSLTREIIYKGVSEIHVVEKDERFLPFLQELQAMHPNFTIHFADALKFDEAQIAHAHKSKKLQIIANLPYNIGTSLILKWLNNKDIFASITVMLQQEVASRITALPRTLHYSSLSVFAQVLCHVEHILNVPAGAFRPKPKVESSVIMLRPKVFTDQVDNVDIEVLNIILRAAFSERRKMVRKTLRNCFGDKLESILEKCDIAATARAEEITPRQYMMLCDYFHL